MSRGFALPLVVVLAMVGAIMAAVMLERQSAQHLSVQRQLGRYREHHASRGLREVVSAWIQSVQNEPVESLLTPDGHALDLEIDDGRVIRVYLRDAQGSLLSDFSELRGAEADDARAAIVNLRQEVGRARFTEYLRPVGPLAVSAVTSPEEVLTAAASVVLGKAATEQYTSAILRARRAGALGASELTAIGNEAGLSAEERRRIGALVTAEPTLWRAVIEVRSTRLVDSGGLLDLYEGLVNLNRRRVGRTTSALDAFQSLGSFLAWRQVPREEWDNR